MGLSKEDYKRAQKNGINKSLAYQRYEYLFWDIERAITEKPGSKVVEWKRWKEVAEKTGISYQTFQRRRQKGMTPEAAAKTPKGAHVGRPRNEDRT